jgi:hypothetical protein
MYIIIVTYTCLHTYIYVLIYNPQVSHHFYAGVITNQSYLDIRNFSPIIAHKIHRNSVKSVIMLHDKIYSGGDRTVLVTGTLS